MFGGVLRCPEVKKEGLSKLRQVDWTGKTQYKLDVDCATKGGGSGIRLWLSGVKCRLGGNHCTSVGR